MSQSTILRILTMFTEVIPSAPNTITTREIEQNLLERGMEISQGQLSRDLANYADIFSVQECGYSEGGKTWQRFGRGNAAVKMSEAEMMYLTIVKEQLDYLPELNTAFVTQKMTDLAKQRKVLQQVCPAHTFFRWEEHYHIIRKHEKLGYIKQPVLKALMKCLNEKAVFKCMSQDEDGLDFLDTIWIKEEHNELFVVGMSQLHGGTNHVYQLSRIMSAECVHQCEAYDLFMPNSRF